MKLIVKTTGKFLLMDPNTNDIVPASRPAVVSQSQFISSRTASGQLDVLASKLSDEATDAEFAETLKESDADVELAVTSFVDRFGPKAPAPAGDNDPGDEA